MSAFVLGFAEEAAQIAGLAWSLAGREGALVALGGELSEPGSTASMSSESVTVEATVGDRTVTVAAGTGSAHDLFADPPPAGSPSAALGRADVRLSGPDEQLTCAFNLTTWGGDPSGGAGLIRHLSIPAGDGAIVLIAARPAGAGDHAAELVSAWQLDPSEDPSPFVEALLSTQYDADGVPTRAGLELWPHDPDAPATRAAGARPLTRSSDGVTAALMHTSAEGIPGVGGYLIVRA